MQNKNLLFLQTLFNILMILSTKIKYIPSMISDRISKISSNEQIFRKAAPQYNNALKSSGYNERITYKKPSAKNRKSRPRKIIWFNPPWSMNVRTNVAKRFLAILDKNFPKNHKFRKILNRNCVKVSYSCLPNMSSIISTHNKKVLSEPTQPEDNPDCNCRNKSTCPLNGKCQQSDVIYQCHIKSSIDDAGKYYIGLTGNTFKSRWNTHKFTFNHEESTNHTQLSNHYWDLKRNEVEPILSWEIIDHASSYRNGSKRCNLCLTEKFNIITSKRELVNTKSELISKCRHVNKFLLDNYKTVPPDGQ